jgi:hypothetical protein
MAKKKNKKEKTKNDRTMINKKKIETSEKQLKNDKEMKDKAKREDDYKEYTYKDTYIYLILIFAVALSLVAIYFIFLNESQTGAGNLNGSNYSNKMTNTSTIVVITKGEEAVAEKEKEVKDCLNRIGISEKVLYVYGKTCIYSQKNTKYIEDLIKEGYGIRMIDINNDSEFIPIYNCISKYLIIEGTPTYVCTNNVTKKEEPFSSMSEIINYVNKC